MSLSDCPKCWDTPCTCGYQYRNYTENSRIELAAAALQMKPEQLKKVLRSRPRKLQGKS